MTHNDHKQGGCCDGQKHQDHIQPEKEKDGCCDGENDKTAKTEKPQEQSGGCCGGGHK